MTKQTMRWLMQIGSSNPHLSALAAATTRSAGPDPAGAAGSGAFATVLTAASQTASATGTSTVSRTATLSPSDETAHRTLSHLTDGDRALINAALGMTLTANGTDAEGRSLAPVSVWLIAADRESGRLPAGQPITAAYLTELRKNASASADSADMVEQYDELLAALNGSSSRQPADVRAQRCDG